MPGGHRGGTQGRVMPDGAVKTGVLYNARLGDNGNPLKGPGGRFLKVDLRGYAGMEKRADGARNSDKRNGEWE
jgi:hypothetical protein